MTEKNVPLPDAAAAGPHQPHRQRLIREQERESGRHTPIIAMTAHARKEDEEGCLAAGMDANISKPIGFAQSLQLIEDTLKKIMD